jgi:hypothetical protein
MYCPDCGAEYQPEIHECAECHVPLVPALPEEDAPTPDAKIVPVFRTTDSMVLPIVTALIESAGIEYFVQGAEALSLIPVGAAGSSVSRASLGAIVHVHEEDAASVREILAAAEQGSLGVDDSTATRAPGTDDP